MVKQTFPVQRTSSFLGGRAGQKSSTGLTRRREEGKGRYKGDREYGRCKVRRKRNANAGEVGNGRGWDPGIKVRKGRGEGEGCLLDSRGRRGHQLLPHCRGAREADLADGV